MGFHTTKQNSKNPPSQGFIIKFEIDFALKKILSNQIVFHSSRSKPEAKRKTSKQIKIDEEEDEEMEEEKEEEGESSSADEEESGEDEEDESGEDDESGDEEESDEDEGQGYTDENQSWLQLAKKKGGVKVQQLSDLMEEDDSGGDDSDIVSRVCNY